jgi:hypothetical protein
VTMTSLNSLTDMSVTASNLTNGANTPYLVTFVSPLALVNGDRAELTFDSNVQPKPSNGMSSGNVDCSGGTQVSTVSCFY